MGAMVEQDKLLQTLLNIGFNDKEAHVYLTVLELSEALPSAISRRSGIKRSTTYLILDQLQKRGLISHIKRSGHLFYQACNPNSLIENQRKKYDEIRKSINDLEQALPELLTLHKDLSSTPQMSVFKGKEGLIQIMEDTLTVKDKMLLCWSNVELCVYDLLRDYYPTYISKKISGGVYLKGVFAYDKMAVRFKKRGVEELREVYLIPKDKYLIENEINIYDDKVAIIAPQDQVGVIIQNAHIANTQRSIFNLAFEYAKILEKDLLTKDDYKYLESEGDEDELTKKINALRKNRPKKSLNKKS